jgi:pyruvate dehydrogenase E2 component (dihydrolipoamide acetyltransferase)
MAIEIKIPRLGWSMEEGTFVGWLKKDGDLVKSGEPLFTLEGEKSAQDIESTDGGTLRMSEDSPQAGAIVKVGQVIGLLMEKDEAVKQNEPVVKVNSEEKRNQPDGLDNDHLVEKSIAPPKPANSEIATRSFSSPRARRKAAELGVELNSLQGSGSTGRITEADVVKAGANHDGAVKTTPVSRPASSSAGQVSIMRRNIAERTTLSFSQIPHFYLRAEVDATRLVRMREDLVGVLEKECGVRITLTDFILLAQATALREYPAANIVWQNNGLLSYTDADVGVVVSLADGMVIPILRAVQKLSFLQLAKERARLVEEVRAGRFNAEIVAGGATSLSNLGTTRVDEFTAIIAPHQSSMLAVGRAAPRPYVVDGHAEVRTTLRLCLSADHRVFDGRTAADFLGKIIELLENPKKLVNDI